MLRDALATFEKLDTPLWADRARAELAGTGRRATDAPARDGLTPAEKRVAELAASGMTNRDVAAELFISSKTVEATLARVYRKLGIRSRAELGQRSARPRNVVRKHTVSGCCQSAIRRQFTPKSLACAG